MIDDLIDVAWGRLMGTLMLKTYVAGFSFEIGGSLNMAIHHYPPCVILLL